MKLSHFAVRDPDGVLAELCMHGCLANGADEPLACAACRLERAVDVCSWADGSTWIAYGLCALCRSLWPSDKVTQLVEHAIANGELPVYVDTFEEDEATS